MLDIGAQLVGRKTKLIDEVLSGKDVHQATADIAGITRKEAKTTNFLTLYGGGLNKLMEGLQCSEAKAKQIQHRIYKSAPEIWRFIGKTIEDVERRGWVYNWYGRRYAFPNRRFSYRAPNYLIQGGCADVVKIAMNHIHEYLRTYKSNMVMQIHDEIVIECHEDECDLMPQVKSIMEEVYPYKYLPLTCGIEWSDKSLADKISIDEHEARDNIPQNQSSTVSQNA